jgi:hypothetical protein
MDGRRWTINAVGFGRAGKYMPTFIIPENKDSNKFGEWGFGGTRIDTERTRIFGILLECVFEHGLTRRGHGFLGFSSNVFLNTD